MMKIILNNISKNFGKKSVLENINYTFYSDNVYLIKGVSGVGKTTLLEIITKKIKCDGLLSYESIDSYDFAYSIKNDLIEYLSVKENLMLISNEEEILNIAKELKIVGILDSYPKNISNGEYQRVSLARLFLYNKNVLILDEPTSALDYDNKDIIYDYLFNHKCNKIIIVVSHDHSDSRFINLTLNDKKLIEVSKNNPTKTNVISDYKQIKLRKKYLGKIVKPILKLYLLKMIMVLFFNIFLILLSFIMINFKDSRDDLVASLQNSLIEVDEITDKAYYLTKYNIGDSNNPSYIS